jgi:hypothetical protein
MRTTIGSAAPRRRTALGWLAVTAITALALTAFAVQPAAAVTTCPGMQLQLEGTYPGAAPNLGVDDDLELRLNGTQIYLNDDDVATNLAPIGFSAPQGGTLRVIATQGSSDNTHAGIHGFQLRCLANNAVQVLNASYVDLSSYTAGGVFYDQTFTIDFAEGVSYDFGGFVQPIDNLPVVNAAKAGSAIPVKFSLDGDQGLAIFAAGFPKSEKVECVGGASLDNVEETTTAGSSGLSYDPSTDLYRYTWKTEKAWAGTCRQLVLRLADGAEYRASFSFS